MKKAKEAKMPKKKKLFGRIVIAILATALAFPFSAIAAEKNTADLQEENTRLKKKADDLFCELLKTNSELVGAKKIMEELARETKKALLGNMALSMLITELIKEKSVPVLRGSVDPEKEEICCGDWILFNPKKICGDACDESGFVREEKIDKNFKPGIHINTSEYFAWIYEPEGQVFYRQALKKAVPQQSIILLNWEE